MNIEDLIEAGITVFREATCHNIIVRNTHSDVRLYGFKTVTLLLTSSMDFGKMFNLIVP